MQQAREDAERLISMYRSIDECPHPVIGRIQGNAFGGGVGLVSVCDVVVAAQDAMFTLSEARLGLVPAVIAPFLLRKAGESFMRRFCLTAETFSASIAREFNLVHDLVEPEKLDSRIGELVEAVLRLAPEAARHTKALLRQIQSSQGIEQRQISAAANARARLSAEAQEGLRAFFEKRSPAWAKGSAEEAVESRGVKSHHVKSQRI
jgi:methylglutaconyl-CoA hydratase